MSRKFLDANHPMFRQIWVRWVTVLFPTGWGLFEFWLHEPFWAILFLAAGGFAFYELIYKGPDQD